jgi:4-oxalmesaconate hydratase
MIIDCHGHYTTAPSALGEFRKIQKAQLGASPRPVFTADRNISDDQIRESLEKNQLATQRKRGVDMTLFSPTAGAMEHHVGDVQTSLDWSRACNDLIHRVCTLYPLDFAGVCQLPQSPGADLSACTAELERCVSELGFVGCNVNPDPSDGYWTGPPLSDRYWYPLYEKMVELDVPGMVHVSCSCNPNFHHTGAHYLNGDTTAFMQFILSDIFTDFPKLRFVIPHGGGAVPYHWGRYRGLAQQLRRPPLDKLMQNVFFDTCVYHQPGIDLLLDVVPIENILFASETHGAVKEIDPLTGFHYDDTRRYVDEANRLSEDSRRKVFELNARRVYPRLNAMLQSQGR